MGDCEAGARQIGASDNCIKLCKGGQAWSKKLTLKLAQKRGRT